MNNEKTTGGLSYYRLSLLSFLKESHPERLTDTESIEARADLAATTYAQAIKDGYPHLQAEELASEVLFLGLHFSKHDTIVNILWNEFADDVPQYEAKEFAIAMQPECEAVFAKIPAGGRFCILCRVRPTLHGIDWDNRNLIGRWRTIRRLI